jgi:hypothetical protein
MTAFAKAEYPDYYQCTDAEYFGVGTFYHLVVKPNQKFGWLNFNSSALGDDSIFLEWNSDDSDFIVFTGDKQVKDRRPVATSYRIEIAPSKVKKSETPNGKLFVGDEADGIDLLCLDYLVSDVSENDAQVSEDSRI